MFQDPNNANILPQALKLAYELRDGKDAQKIDSLISEIYILSGGYYKQTKLTEGEQVEGLFVGTVGSSSQFNSGSIARNTKGVLQNDGSVLLVGKLYNGPVIEDAMFFEPQGDKNKFEVKYTVFANGYQNDKYIFKPIVEFDNLCDAREFAKKAEDDSKFMEPSEALKSIRIIPTFKF